MSERSFDDVLDHDCLEYVQAERAPVNAGMVAIELERLGNLDGAFWPQATKAQWGSAIDRLVAAGKLRRVNGTDVAIVPEEPKKKPAAAAQLSLFDE